MINSILMINSRFYSGWSKEIKTAVKIKWHERAFKNKQAQQ